VAWRALGRTLAVRPAHELQPVALGTAPREMLPLLDALNGLFARIAALLESERRFTSDAAHELRTPIAAIRAQAQVALGEADDALRGRALRQTLEGCDRATRLVDQLLTLARLEAEPGAAEQRVDLGAVVQATLAELAPRALAKGQRIELDAASSCVVAGDPTLLGVLVRNLADNAVRYSPAGARIAVRVTRDQRTVALQVDDSGPGLAGEDLPRLGERFFRVPGSEESGSGLGWSIVRRIATAHGAQVSVGRSASLGGLAVQVRFAAL
jgi:two-component system, OmpR family, sensor histidine kinase QseC